MSKYLVKILSICAIVVLLCVTVVGAAICAAEAVGCTLTVAELNAVGELENNADNITIVVDGKEYKDKVTVAKYTEVEVKYNRTGFEFDGWYEGEYDVNTDRSLSESSAYKFEIKKSTKLTAQNHIKEFNVTYKYEKAPLTSQKVKYGAALEECPTDLNTGEKSFEGWQICDAEGNALEAKAYKTADFEKADESEICLAPYFGETIEYTVGVKFSAVSDKKEQDITLTALNDAKNLTYTAPERKDYNLVGATFNGKTYKYENGAFTDLSKDIIRNNVLNVEITLVWQVKDEFNKSFTFKFRGVAADSENDYMGVFDNTGTIVTVDDVLVTFDDKEGCFDVTDDVFSKYIQPFIDKGNITTQPNNGETVTFAKRVLYTVGSTGTNEELYLDPNKEYTSLPFTEILNFLLGQNKLDEQITVYFIFAPASK